MKGKTNALKQAVAEVERLSVSDQQQIGRQMLQHIDKLRALRDDIDEGIRSLEGGEGAALDINEVIAEAQHRYDKGE